MEWLDLAKADCGQNDMLQELATELTETEQRERQRIAEKIHEDPQQLLVGSKLRATAMRMQTEMSPVLGSTARELESLLEQSIAKARSLSYEISPPMPHVVCAGSTGKKSPSSTSLSCEDGPE
ncbi:MAG: histidine kinase [Acidobacteriota bacterium]